MDPFFSVSKLEKFTVVQFQTASLMNALDLERIKQAIDNLVDDGAHLLLLDFTQVKYLSSQAIGIVIALQRKTSSLPGGKLVLCGVGPQLLQLLKLTRLDRLLTIRDTARDAVAG